MAGPPPYQAILDLLRVLPAADAQNRLMRSTDRDLAMVLVYLPEDRRRAFLSHVGSAKEQRVKLEMERLSRSRLQYRYYEQACAAILGVLRGSQPRGGRSFYRPPGRSN